MARFNTLAEIATEMGISVEYLRILSRKPGFPQALRERRGNSRVFVTADVIAWHRRELKRPGVLPYPPDGPVKDPLEPAPARGPENPAWETAALEPIRILLEGGTIDLGAPHLVEALAAHLHAEWADWTWHILHDCGQAEADGAIRIPAADVRRWEEKGMGLSYFRLPEEQKPIERIAARKVLALVAAYLGGMADA